MKITTNLSGHPYGGHLIENVGKRVAQLADLPPGTDIVVEQGGVPGEIVIGVSCTIPFDEWVGVDAALREELPCTVTVRWLNQGRRKCTDCAGSGIYTGLHERRRCPTCNGRGER